jgi:hypothetical protein
MIAKKIRLADLAGFVAGISLGILFLMLLVGCADSPPWGAWSKSPSPQQVATALRRVDTYIYFSNYQIYRHSGRGDYIFWDGQTWVTSNEPPLEVTAELLQASPAVQLDFSDHPSKHHREIVARYPRDWQSPNSFVAAATP